MQKSSAGMQRVIAKPKLGLSLSFCSQYMFVIPLHSKFEIESPFIFCNSPLNEISLLHLYEAASIQGVNSGSAANGSALNPQCVFPED
jgi:hypothetical protein